MKLTVNQLRRIIKEEVQKSLMEAVDYSDLEGNMDQFMPDDPDMQDEWYEILQTKNKSMLRNFLQDNADPELMSGYMPRGGSIGGFVNYLVGKR